MTNRPLLSNGVQDDEDEALSVVTSPPSLNTAAPTHAGKEVSDAEQHAAAEEALANIDAKAEAKSLRRAKNDFFKQVDAIGDTVGKSKTAMISLAIEVTDAACKKLINLDDADGIYNRVRERAKAAATIDDVGELPDEVTDEGAHDQPDEQKRNKTRDVQISKLKAFIEVGMRHPDEAGELIRTARNVAVELLAEGSCKKGSTYTNMGYIAVQQKKQKHILSADDIRKLLTAPTSGKANEPADGVKKMLDALTSMQAAKKGGKERAPVDHPDLDEAIAHLFKALGEIAPERLKEHTDKAAKSETKAAVAAFRQQLSSLPAGVSNWRIVKAA